MLRSLLSERCVQLHITPVCMLHIAQYRPREAFMLSAADCGPGGGERGAGCKEGADTCTVRGSGHHIHICQQQVTHRTHECTLHRSWTRWCPACILLGMMNFSIAHQTSQGAREKSNRSCWAWGVNASVVLLPPRPEVRATDAFLKEGEQERRRALLEEMLAAADRGSMSWDDAEVRVCCEELSPAGFTLVCAQYHFPPLPASPWQQVLAAVHIASVQLAMTMKISTHFEPLPYGFAQDGPGWSADFPSSSSSGAGSSASSGSQEGLQPQLARAASPAASSAAADMDYAEPPAFPVFNFLSQVRSIRMTTSAAHASALYMRCN